MSRQRIPVWPKNAVLKRLEYEDGPLCQECSKPYHDAKHIQYGNDEFNPMKHWFVQPPAQEKENQA